MAFYNEFFIEENNELKHVGSCCGSNTPDYFDEVKSIADWNTQLEKVKADNGFYPHSDIHPFPWSSYKTSDNLIILRKANRKWFLFWKPSHEVWINAEDFGRLDNNQEYFIPMNRKYYQKSDNLDSVKKRLAVVLNLPVLIKK